MRSGKLFPHWPHYRVPIKMLSSGMPGWNQAFPHLRDNQGIGRVIDFAALRNAAGCLIATKQAELTRWKPVRSYGSLHAPANWRRSLILLILLFGNNDHLFGAARLPFGAGRALGSRFF